MGYNYGIVLKVLAIIAVVILGLTVYVAIENQRAAEQTIRKAAQTPKTVATPVGHENPQENNENSEGNSPSWYGFFTWPNSTTTWAILLTLWAVAWQSHETKKAAQAALISANAAVAQIEMVKSKERAQIRMEIDPLNLVYDQKADGYPIQLRVVLDGTTRAIILNESIAAYLADSPPSKLKPWEPLGIPGTFTPDLSPMPRVIFIQADNDFCENETDHQRVNLVRERKLDVYVTGKIRYRDLFGDEWELGIDRVWHQWGGWDGGDGKITGVWSEAGNGKGDYHRKVEEPPKAN